MKERRIKFHEGVSDTDKLKMLFPNGGLPMLDDFMADRGGNEKRVLDLFTKHPHHQNVTVL